MDDPKEIVSSRHNMMDARMNCSSMFKQTGSQHWEGEVGTRSHPNQEAIYTWCTLRRGKSVFSNKVLMGSYQTKFRAGSMPTSSWPTQNKFCGIFVDFCFICFWGAYYFVFCFFILIFIFVFLQGLLCLLIWGGCFLFVWKRERRT